MRSAEVGSESFLGLNRREALRWITFGMTGICGGAIAARVRQDRPSQSGLGLVLYCCSHRRNWLKQQQPDFDLFTSSNFLEHCARVGASGAQVRLGVLSPEMARGIRDAAEQRQLFLDGIVNPPEDSADLARFEAEIRSAAAVGVLAVRTVVMPGRRYERFKTLDDFREHERRALRMLQLAAPVVEKHQVRLAVENHKDQRIEERLRLFQQIDSEFVGACLDTGNSIALLEDPLQTVEALAPWTHTVHLKDQAVQPTEQGFLLGDIPLGQGSLDLPAIVSQIRRVQPHVRFHLELITRDPLLVPCLTDDYWQTLPDVSGQTLARMLNWVREHSVETLQRPSEMTAEERLGLEDANVADSLRYARDVLKLNRLAAEQ